MPLFKSNKNKSASTATTPAQTPRTSMQATRPKTTTMTPEEALRMIMEKSVNGVGVDALFRHNFQSTKSFA
ncbi:hypothetical protein B0O80DRAFT_525039 [Mortierella sp. GBAus27b]|nr:hypothetical protein B0O80DRAFT_525039 [Mortierella sp. GBAus27b]